MQTLADRLDERVRAGNLRRLRVGGCGLIDFASNDYLGLAKSPFLAEMIAHEVANSGNAFNGSAGSRLLTGNTAYAELLEEHIASFHGVEAALLFNCGYMANAGLVSAVASKGDTVIFDVQVHASTYDGIALSRCRAVPFRHNDIEHLKRRLQTHAGKGNIYICIESTYSTDGSTAPLKDICNLSDIYNARLIIDEAHTIGVTGPQGCGSVASAGVIEHVFAVVATYGKALGVHGAAVLGSRSLKQYLINYSRPFIYTTALPFQALAAIKCAYDLFPKLDRERAAICRLMQAFPNTPSHIQTVQIPGNQAVQSMSKRLEEAGFDVRALTSPTVRRGREALRICLHAYNTPNQVEHLMKAIEHFQRVS